MSSLIRKALFAAVAIGAIAPVAGAQQRMAGPRWQGWVGCWTAVSNAVAWDSNNGEPTTVCVTPTSDTASVDIITLASKKVVGRARVTANGQAVPLSAGACTGTEQARFSADGRRVFMRSMVDCNGSKTETSSLLAITSAGEWIDVRSVASGGASNVRVARYRESAISPDLPPGIVAAIGPRSIGATGARIAAGSTFGNDAIIEASKFVDAGVVSGWIMESGQRFAVDAWSLTQLADAGVPGQVTDAMIDVSNPRGNSMGTYANRGRYVEPYGRGASDWWDQDTGMRISVYSYPTYDPWGFGWGWGYPIGYFGNYGRAYDYGRGLAVVGLGWGYGFGYGSGYGRGRSIGYYYPPVIVLHQGNGGGGDYTHGQAVNGGGYTTGRTATPTPSTSAGGVPTGTTTPSPSGSTTGAPSAPTKAAESSGRTAKPRP